MKIKTLPQLIASTMLASIIGLLVQTGVSAEPKPAKTTAFSEVSPDYQRTRLSSGKFKPETYIFAQGELIDNTNGDESLQKLTFSGVAHNIAPALAEADFIPASSKSEADLLIVVSWGKTKPYDKSLVDMGITNIADAFRNMEQLNYLNDTQLAEQNTLSNLLQLEFETAMNLTIQSQRMFDLMREQQNHYNARLLGYQTDLYRSQLYGDTVVSMQWQRNDLMEELESSRYFVVLQAYDFQKAWKEKTRKMLWTTRFSIRAKGRNFDEQLWDMAMASSRVLGTDTRGLARNLEIPHIEFGELEYLGVEEN